MQVTEQFVSALDYAVRLHGEQMRKGQATAKALLAESGQLAPEYKMSLGIAARDLDLCVSCVSDALDYCNNAGAMLDEVAADLE